MTIAQQTYRDAMARLGAAVNVVTTDGPAGRAGFTASAVCSVTDDPPTLLVCMNRASDRHKVFKRNGVICVNTLSAGQQELSHEFAGPHTMEERFACGTWYALETGAPVLQGAVVAFDCVMSEVTEIGTHSVFFCEVRAIRVGSVHEGLIYFGRAYHRIGHMT